MDSTAFMCTSKDNLSQTLPNLYKDSVSKTIYLHTNLMPQPPFRVRKAVISCLFCTKCTCLWVFADRYLALICRQEPLNPSAGQLWRSLTSPWYLFSHIISDLSIQCANDLISYRWIRYWFLKSISEEKSYIEAFFI